MLQHFALSSLIIIVLHPYATCIIHTDLCEVDSRLQVSYDPSCEDILLSLPNIHLNPYHSLHDHLWIFSHYLHECVPLENLSQVYVYMNVSKLQDRSLCTHAPVQYNRTLQPAWGLCVMKGLLASLGIPEQNLFYGKHMKEKCFGKVVKFRGRFREMIFHMREEGKRVMLGEDMQNQALRKLGVGAMNGLDVKTYFSRWMPKVRVLVYGREDVRRRRWEEQSLGEFLNWIRGKNDVEVKYLKALSKDVKGQLQDFAWADVVATMHGAALANSIVMQDGTDIVEVWKCCRDDVRGDTRKRRRWTGWHADVVGVGLMYVQCHRIGKVLEIGNKELRTGNRESRKGEKGEKNFWCKEKKVQVELREIAGIVNWVVMKQSKRIRKEWRREIRRLGFMGGFLTGLLLVGIKMVRCVTRRKWVS